MKYLSNAKINLNLMITGIDDEGYHLLYSVVSMVDLCDEIEIELNDTNKIVLECDDLNVPVDERNIIIKCINELKKYKSFEQGMKIVLNKKIPSQAGLGGGSSNGATVLLALNNLLNLKLTKEELANIGIKVGADIPLFIYNKLALMEGRGEKITIINNEEFKPWVLLVKPIKGVNTKEAFMLYDRMIKTKEYTPLILHKLIENNNIEGIKELIKNDLQRSAIYLVEEIKDVINDLNNLEAFASCMSGSGSCCFGLYFDKEKALEAKGKLKTKYNFVELVKML